MTALRTVAMVLLTKEKNVTVETHLLRSDDFVIIKAAVDIGVGLSEAPDPQDWKMASKNLGFKWSKKP